MPDLAVTSNNQSPPPPPPSGDPIQAEKYITQLIELIDQDKLLVSHTDLSKFNPGALQDHYRLELKTYQVEVSHNKHPNTDKEAFVILFTNIKNVAEQDCEKVILAYMHLDENQFIRFKKVSIQQIERIRRAEEERKLKNALQPIDIILQDLTNVSSEPISQIN